MPLTFFMRACSSLDANVDDAGILHLRNNNGHLPGIFIVWQYVDLSVLLTTTYLCKSVPFVLAYIKGFHDIPALIASQVAHSNLSYGTSRPIQSIGPS